RKLLGLVEAVQMTEHADEDFLHQILGPLAIPDAAIDEVEQAGLVAVHQGAEGLGIARQVSLRETAVVELTQRPAVADARRLEGWCGHRTLRPSIRRTTITTSAMTSSR